LFQGASGLSACCCDLVEARENSLVLCVPGHPVFTDWCDHGRLGRFWPCPPQSLHRLTSEIRVNELSTLVDFGLLLRCGITIDGRRAHCEEAGPPLEQRVEPPFPPAARAKRSCHLDEPARMRLRHGLDLGSHAIELARMLRFPATSLRGAFSTPSRYVLEQILPPMTRRTDNNREGAPS
jgi:hypothetical protein